MKKLKLLWLCNAALRGSADCCGSGTWLGAMARGLLDSGEIELGIIASGPVRQLTRTDHNDFKQWLYPANSQQIGDGLPSASLVREIVAAAEDFCPDLVHTWGTEKFLGLLPARGLLKYPSILEMQGFQAEIAKVYNAGMTLTERLRCIGIKELLKRRTMNADRRDFVRCGLREVEIIRGHKFVDVQTAWAAAHVHAIAHKVRLFPVDLVLRQPFYVSNAWHPPTRPTLFCTAAYSFPIKGLHVAVRALDLLRNRIPDIRLRIAGIHQKIGIRQSGYMRWVNKTIKRLNLSNAIEWLGPLSGEQIVMELNNASAVVIPTFIENCCTALQEAMVIGTPVVVSFVGGIPSLGKDEETCLFFSPGDEAMCAYQLQRVLTDDKLADRISKASRKIGAVRNDRQRIVKRQLEIYRQVLEVL
jgi:glycosyltransferase involved in cell wall biosynthesis